MIELTAAKDDAGRRLDRILRKALPDLSLSLIHRLLRQRKILVDNKPATPNHRIEQGMVIKINAPVTYVNNQVNNPIVNYDNFMVNKNNLRLQTPNPEPRTLNPILSPVPSPESPVPILWHGSGIIVFNKPQGLSTHGPQSLDGIVNAWLSSGGEGPLPRSLSFKPGPLHRLDKPTSGAIVFSQTLEGAKLFSALLRERKIEKIYVAIVEGRIAKEEVKGSITTKEEGKGKREKSKRIKYGEIIWRDSLEHDKNARKSLVSPRPYSIRPPLRLKPSRDIRHTGAFFGAPAQPHKSKNTATPCTLGAPFPISKEAITMVKTLASNDKYSLIEARIKTGRHHQIRAQAASHGHPLAGDIKYGGKPLSSQSYGGCFFLHAWKIRFNESPDGFPREIIAPLPEAFQAWIEALFKR